MLLLLLQSPSSFQINRHGVHIVSYCILIMTDRTQRNQKIWRIFVLFLSETNKSRLGRAQKLFGMTQPPMYSYSQLNIFNSSRQQINVSFFVLVLIASRDFSYRTYYRPLSSAWNLGPMGVNFSISRVLSIIVWLIS